MEHNVSESKYLEDQFLKEEYASSTLKTKRCELIYNEINGSTDIEWIAERNSFVKEQSIMQRDISKMKHVLSMFLKENEDLKKDNEKLKKDNISLSKDTRTLREKLDEVYSHLMHTENLGLNDFIRASLHDDNKIQSNEERRLDDRERRDEEFMSPSRYKKRRNHMYSKMKEIFQQLLDENEKLKSDVEGLRNKIESGIDQQKKELEVPAQSISRNIDTKFEDQTTIRTMDEETAHLTDEQKSTEDESYFMREQQSIDDDSYLLRDQFMKYRTVKCCGFTIQRNTVKFFRLYFTLIILLIIGGGVFYCIEHPAAKRRLEDENAIFWIHKSEIFKLLHHHNSTQSMKETETIFEDLQKHIIGFNDGPNEINEWSLTTSIIFAFTIISTIGYGTFTPSTKSGRIFLIVYGLIGIPITALSIGSIAERVFYVFTWLSQVGKDKIGESFRHFDQDGSGKLSKQEFEEAVRSLGFDLCEESFANLYEFIDKDNDESISSEEFRIAIKFMSADVTEAAGHKNRLFIIALGITTWLGFGVVVFKMVENWSIHETLYFLFVSLATIGLGDFTPKTQFGSFFLMAFSFIGLGLVAVLIAAIQAFVVELGRRSAKMINKNMELHHCVQRLKQIAIFTSLDDEKLTLLARKVTIYNPFMDIVIEGEEIDSVYVLLDGVVNVKKETSGEKIRVSAPALLFESVFNDDSNSFLADASVSTIGNVHMFTIHKDSWESLMTNQKVTGMGEAFQDGTEIMGI